MEVKYVRRVAEPSNKRVIKGKIYKWVDGCIRDEQNNPMTTAKNTDYWVEVPSYQYVSQERHEERMSKHGGRKQEEDRIFRHGGRNQGKSAQIQDLKINITPGMLSMRDVADRIRLSCNPDPLLFASERLGRTSWEKHVWPEAGLVDMDYSSIEARLLNVNLKPEVTKMLKIEKVTMLNGCNTDHLSEDDILNHIQNEEAKIATLEKLKTKSSAIDALKVKHTDNITLLVELLDSKAKK